MGWKSHVKDAVYLNFGVREEEVDRLLPPGTSLDTRLHRGESWGFFSLILFRHDRLRHQRLFWPSFGFSQANLRVYIEDTGGNPSIYFKRLFMPGFYARFCRWLWQQPVTSMDCAFPGTVHPGGEYRWRLEGKGAGNISGKVEESRNPRGNLVSLFENSESLLTFFQDRPFAYYGAGMNDVYRLNTFASRGEVRSFQVKEWELGFLAGDLERHNFPEALNSNFYVSEIQLDFEGPESVPLTELTTV